ncbi:hypothetical protein O181_093176, partial [Austropuccinia psidii MF-1]|nr:hypothetical protein [Austropuccinia psidii MF-1]
ANLTPGLEQYYADFVTMTRAVEYALGVQCEADLSVVSERLVSSKNVMIAFQKALTLIPTYAAKAGPTTPTGLSVQSQANRLSAYYSNVATSIPENNSNEHSSPSFQKRADQKLCNLSCGQKSFRKRVKLVQNSSTLETGNDQVTGAVQNTQAPKNCIATMAMSKQWQWEGPSASLAPHTMGPAAYDDHLYYSFGGVAEANFDSYMQTICTENHYSKAQKINEFRYGHGEFSLATNFKATDDQLRAWGDAQRFRFSQESFWTFWAFRSSTKQWSYLDAVEDGLLPQDPSQYFSPSVCQPYTSKTLNSSISQ